jgi:hypothetical protein
MSPLFSCNAYSVLGLDSSASRRAISRRSKEIVHRLKNDETPEYKTDIATIIKTDRSEASVKDAVRRLSSPVKRINEYFFWFEIENDADEKDLDLLRDNQYDEAINNWKYRAEKSLTAKRNLAIASSLLLSHTGYKKYLKKSVDAWQDVIKSDRYWSHFEKVYALNDEIGTSKSAIGDFRVKVLDYLSDFYSDVSRANKDRTVYAAFSAAFGVKGQKVQDEVLSPIFEQIHDASEQLRKLNASENKILSSQVNMTIDRLVKKIQDLFHEIKELGLYEDSQSKILRDKAAEAINIVAVDLFNNLNEMTKSVDLSKIAKSLAAGPAVISQMNKNFTIMRDASSREKIIKPILDLIIQGEFSKALDYSYQEKENHKEDAVLQGQLRDKIQWCVTADAGNAYTEAKKLFDEGDFKNAELGFRNVYDTVYSYVSDFDFNKSSLDATLGSLWTKLANLNASNIEDIHAYSKQIIENSDAAIKAKGAWNLPVLTLLLNSAIHLRLSQITPEMKKQSVKHAPPLFTLNGFGTKIYGDTLYLVLLFIPVLPLASYILKVNRSRHFTFYSRKPLASWKKWWLWGLPLAILVIIFASALSSGPGSSASSDTSATSDSSSSASGTSSTAWQTCSDEYNSLKGQLDSTNSEMDSDDSAGNTDAYNALVPQQNSLVQQVNNQATECNNLR